MNFVKLFILFVSFGIIAENSEEEKRKPLGYFFQDAMLGVMVKKGLYEDSSSYFAGVELSTYFFKKKTSTAFLTFFMRTPLVDKVKFLGSVGCNLNSAKGTLGLEYSFEFKERKLIAIFSAAWFFPFNSIPKISLMIGSELGEKVFFAAGGSTYSSPKIVNEVELIKEKATFEKLKNSSTKMSREEISEIVEQFLEKQNFTEETKEEYKIILDSVLSGEKARSDVPPAYLLIGKSGSGKTFLNELIEQILKENDKLRKNIITVELPMETLLQQTRISLVQLTIGGENKTQDVMSVFYSLARSRIQKALKNNPQATHVILTFPELDKLMIRKENEMLNHSAKRISDDILSELLKAFDTKKGMFWEKLYQDIDFKENQRTYSLLLDGSFVDVYKMFKKEINEVITPEELKEIVRKNFNAKGNNENTADQLFNRFDIKPIPVVTFEDALDVYLKSESEKKKPVKELLEKIDELAKDLVKENNKKTEEEYKECIKIISAFYFAIMKEVNERGYRGLSIFDNISDRVFKKINQTLSDDTKTSKQKAKEVSSELKKYGTSKLQEKFYKREFTLGNYNSHFKGSEWERKSQAIVVDSNTFNKFLDLVACKHEVPSFVIENNQIIFVGEGVNEFSIENSINRLHNNLIAAR